MYYKSKSTFYVKQYGPAALILLISFVLIGSGIYIYMSKGKTSATQNKEVIVASDNLKSEDSVSDSNTDEVKEDKNEEKVETNEEVITKLPDKYSKLKSLEKTSEFNIDKVLDSKKIRVSIPDTSKKMDVTLIGVNFNNSESDVVSKMQEDLKDKKINLAFDEVKEDSSNIYAYVYLNNELYNAKILEKGLATFQEEPKNKALATELKQSQTYAKQMATGIWAN